MAPRPAEDWTCRGRPGRCGQLPFAALLAVCAADPSPAGTRDAELLASPPPPARGHAKVTALPRGGR
ncbi:hypothetical protein ABZ806_04905 [Spirillospora sp. NPDC047418]